METSFEDYQRELRVVEENAVSKASLAYAESLDNAEFKNSLDESLRVMFGAISYTDFELLTPTLRHPEVMYSSSVRLYDRRNARNSDRYNIAWVDRRGSHAMFIAYYDTENPLGRDNKLNVHVFGLDPRVLIDPTRYVNMVMDGAKKPWGESTFELESLIREIGGKFNDSDFTGGTPFNVEFFNKMHESAPLGEDGLKPLPYRIVKAIIAYTKVNQGGNTYRDDIVNNLQMPLLWNQMMGGFVYNYYDSLADGHSLYSMSPNFEEQEEWNYVVKERAVKYDSEVNDAWVKIAEHILYNCC